MTERKLDFIIAGAARTGTTASMNYLSAIDTVHCGQELFRYWDDHSILMPPGCFRDICKPGDAVPHGTTQLAIDRSLRELDEKAGRVCFFGNKTPLYSFRLEGLQREIFPGKCIMTWRDSEGTAMSCIRRALDQNDRFGAGRRGISAMADTLASAFALNRMESHDVMIVPNRAVVANWESAVSMTASFFMGIEPVLFDHKRIGVIEERRIKTTLLKERRSRTSIASTADLTAIDLIDRIGLDKILNQDTPFLLSEVRGDLRKALSSAAKDPVMELVKLAEDEGDPLVIREILKWRDHRMKDLNSLEQLPRRRNKMR